MPATVPTPQYQAGGPTKVSLYVANKSDNHDVLGAHHAPVYDRKGPVRTYPLRTDNRPWRGSGAAQHRRKRRLCLFTYQAPGGLRDPGWSSPTHYAVYKSIYPSLCQHNP